jgi:hypothetical protein
MHFGSLPEAWMVGTKAMSDEIEVFDPLASAIGELREELLLWIDTETTRLREHADGLAREEEGTAARASRLTASSSRRVANRGSSRSRSALARPATATRERGADRDPEVETVSPPITPPEQPSDHESRLFGSNPRERLDALARLLDHRLKQAQEDSKTRSGTS